MLLPCVPCTLQVICPFLIFISLTSPARILSDAYPSGITVSGSGAGPFQTAGGILHDILSIK